MAGYTSSSFEADPIKAPGLIPLDSWFHYHLKMIATCKGCGRRREVHTAELIKRYGYGGTFGERELAALAPKLRCIDCERHGPTLTLEVKKG